MIWSVLYRPSTSPVARQQVASLFFFLLLKIEEKKRAALNVPVSNSFHPNSSTPLLYYHFVVSPSVIVCRQVGHWTISREKGISLEFFIFLFFNFVCSFVVAHFSLYDLHPRTICTSPPTRTKPRPLPFWRALCRFLKLTILDFLPVFFFRLVLLLAGGTTLICSSRFFHFSFEQHRKEIFWKYERRTGTRCRSVRYRWQW